MSFQSLGLSAELLRGIEQKGYREPTPVQAQAIPFILQGRDVLARAQTGTGKTAAFTLPMLQRLSQRAQGGRRPVRALVLTPTRELAAQVAQSVSEYGAHLPLRAAMLIGGVNIKPQIAALARGADIVIATPGRLLDHAGQRTIDLSRVELLVLDEADRMLDMGFIHDVKRVLGLLPADKQSLLFSATFSPDVRKLAGGLLRQPAEVSVAAQNAPAALVDHRVHPVDKERKRELLTHLIATRNWRRVLVFTRTKHGANRLAGMLERDGFKAAAIHGNKSQSARTRALADFKSGSLRVLVATDIAARGLDIVELPHVVNFELPNVPEDYVHRIGRTGRAGRSGEAVSLVCSDEKAHLAGIESLLRQPLERVVVPGFEPRAQGSSARPSDGRHGHSGSARATSREHGSAIPRSRGQGSRAQGSQGSRGQGSRAPGSRAQGGPDPARSEGSRAQRNRGHGDRARGAARGARRH
ncbi:MAG TPA: DEAD/DEAH box helicase [Gammaproteobacteria bacterium]|nr:DEAD/DEAH box helicase [Gammaproteobacteria bacterium]